MRGNAGAESPDKGFINELEQGGLEIK